MAALWQVRRMLDEESVQLMLQEFEPAPQRVQAVWHSTLSTAAQHLVEHLTFGFGALSI